MLQPVPLKQRKFYQIKFSHPKKKFIILYPKIINFSNEKIILYLPEKISNTFPKIKKKQNKKNSFPNEKNFLYVLETIIFQTKCLLYLPEFLE